MGKEKDVIKIATAEDEENITKIVAPEHESEIPIGNGKRKKVFWARVGFGNRTQFKSFFKKKIRESVDTGLFGIEGHHDGAPEGDVNGENTIFFLNPQSLDEKTLRVYEGSTPKKEGLEYTYSSETRVLFFIKAPKDNVRVEYDYYDPEIYENIFNDSFLIALIFLCAREIENHDKRVFKSPEEIGNLTTMEVNEILSLYTANKPFNQIKVEDDKLKNLSASPLSLEGDAMPKETISILGEERSGETLQETTKS